MLYLQSSKVLTLHTVDIFTGSYYSFAVFRLYKLFNIYYYLYIIIYILLFILYIFCLCYSEGSTVVKWLIYLFKDSTVTDIQLAAAIEKKVSNGRLGDSAETVIEDSIIVGGKDNLLNLCIVPI